MNEREVPSFHVQDSAIAQREKKKEIGQDLEITSVPKVHNGSMLVCGRLNGHEFLAHIYAQEPPVSTWEIGKSGIIRLEIRRTADDRVVFDWDRGMNVVKENPAPQRLRLIKESMIQGMVDFLTSGALVDACHKYVENIKEVVRISPAVLADITEKTERLAKQDSNLQSGERESIKGGDDLEKMKRHWQKALERFDKMDAAHRENSPRCESNEVEQLRTELNERLKRVCENRSPRQGL